MVIKRKEEMYICCLAQNFLAEWQGIAVFDLDVWTKVEKILDKEEQ